MNSSASSGSSAHSPEQPRRRPGAVAGPLQAPGAEQMGERIGDLQQIGARHQILADALLQEREDVADAVELALQIGRFAAERPAGVHHGERQIVPDVGVDPGERELQRPYAGMAPVLEQRPPAGRRPASGGRRVHGRQIAPGEEHVQRGGGPPVGEPAAVDAPADLLRDRQIDPVEDRDPVRRRPVRAQRAHALHHGADRGRAAVGPCRRTVPSVPCRQRPSRPPDDAVTGRGFPGTGEWLYARTVSFMNPVHISDGSAR